MANNNAGQNQGATTANYKLILGNLMSLTSTSATSNGIKSIDYCPSLMGMFAGVRHLPLTWLSQDSAIEIYLTEDIKNILFTDTASG